MKRLFRLTAAAGVVAFLSAGSLALAQRGGFRPPPSVRPAPPPVRPPPIEPVMPHPVPPGRPPGNPGIRPPIPEPMPGPEFGIRVPQRPSRTSIQAQVELALRANNPPQALDILRANGGFLEGPQRLALTRRAIDGFIPQVEKGDPWSGLRDVRQALRTLEPGEGDLGTQLQGMEARLQRRILAEGLERVVTQAEQERWPQAGDQAREWLGQQSQAGGLSPELGPAAEVQQAMREMADVGRDASRLQRLQGTLEKGGPPEETARTLEALRGEKLPPSVKASVSGLEALARLQVAAEQPASAPVEVAQLKAVVRDFEQARAALPGGETDSTLGRRVQQDLAFKAFLDGHPTEARGLLPADGPAPHAADLLRDMKALVDGKGEVSSTPARRAVEREPSRGGDTPRGPPPGLEPLPPEGDPRGWRPTVAESARADLPPLESTPEPRPRSDGHAPPADRPLERAARLEQPWREQARATLNRETVTVNRHAAQAVQHLQQLRQQLQQQDEDDDCALAEIEHLLQRPLTPAERLRARALLRQGRAAAAIAEHLKQLDSRQFGVRSPLALPPDAGASP